LDKPLKSYPVVKEFEARLQHYRTIAPKTAGDFEQVYQRRTPPGVSGRWDYLKKNFNDAMGQTILAHIDQI
jgi:hypothetical protein